MKTKHKERTDRFTSLNPATGLPFWEGKQSSPTEVNRAVHEAEVAFASWSHLRVDERITYLEAFRDALKAKQASFARLISEETGKPLWESKTEVGAMLGKVAISIEAYEERCRVRLNEMPGAMNVTRFKPHGVIGVLGPFNLPGHLPNGHIIPALLAGNAVVFKPSELTPAVGEQLVSLWDDIGLPEGVLQCVQGGREVGAVLASHTLLKGLYFTGSYSTGQFLHQQFAGHPEKILALEMGGNNPLIVHQMADIDAAAYTTIQSAYITSGQRCVCARRLIVPAGREGDGFVDALVRWIEKIKIGAYTETPEPFMGPLISIEAANRLMHAQQDLLKRGADALVPMQRDESCAAMLSPGLLEVTGLTERDDHEHFGPLLQLIRVPDFDAAIDEANRTEYGLSAGLLCDDETLYREFFQRSRAGIVNWNRQITGASSAAPFGGVGKSGNHRASAYFAADYCAFPVASIEASELALPKQLTPGIGEQIEKT